METVVFLIAAAVCLAGAVGVVVNSKPVHAALSLVATLFGIAVLFVAQEAHFLAVVQVIVYAGAIVVLFLFVLMLLGVDRSEDISVEPLVGQRVAAAVIGIAILALPIAAMWSVEFEATGIRGASGRLSDTASDLEALGESLFTTYVFAFEVTSVLLVIAVVGAVVLARRVPRSEEIIDPGQEDAEAGVRARLAGEHVDPEPVLDETPESEEVAP